MIFDFMIFLYSIEVEQSVLGGFLFDDDNSECIQKVFLIFKLELFYVCFYQVIFVEMCQMYCDYKFVDLLILFDVLESKGLIEIVGGFVYLVEMLKNMLSVVNIVVYVMCVCEIVMECYGIEKIMKVIELFYVCNGMMVEQKFDVIQGLFIEIIEYVKIG